LVGVGVLTGVGVRPGVVFGDGVGVVLGEGVGIGFRSLGPTWPMTGIREPNPRMNGTVREPCSCGCRKST
jgi:hypothetical protein